MDAATAVARKVVELALDEPDFVYPNFGAEGCYNRLTLETATRKGLELPEGVSVLCCIVGKAVIREGLASEEELEDTSSSARDLIDSLTGDVIDHNATNFVSAVQRRQDDQTPWGLAVTQAVHEFAMRGVDVREILGDELYARVKKLEVVA